jgi:hypothetical protein
MTQCLHNQTSAVGSYTHSRDRDYGKFLDQANYCKHLSNYRTRDALVTKVTATNTVKVKVNFALEEATKAQRDV